MSRAAVKKLQILSGSHHPALAKSVALKLGLKLHNAQLHKFANGEVKCQLDESVRGDDVFIIQSHSSSVNDAIIEQAIMIDAAKRASARHVTAVCPFLGYARQDRKATGREPISARLMIDILATAGAHRIVSIDLHSGQIQGFFNGPFDHLTALPVLADCLRKRFKEDLVIVSPDAGRVKVADRYSAKLSSGLAIIHKRRLKAGHTQALHVIGDVKDRHCVIVDDMIDTASTMAPAATLLKKKGAKTVSAVATHGIFSDPARQRLDDSCLDRLIYTDTLPTSLKLKNVKVETISVAGLLASAIKAIFEEQSVSAIFDGDNQI
jgi:ribose-phosphate pyrophosphokinase